MKQKIPIFFFFIFIIFACNQNIKLQDNQMVFNVDTTLLSKSYLDTSLNIKFKIPKSYIEINIAKIDTCKTNGLKHYYIDSSDNKSVLMIYDIRKIETNQINKILNSPYKFLNQNKYWDTIVYDTFSYNNFKVQQLMFQSKKLIAFNLYYSLNNKYNFYTVFSSDINKYQVKAKEIESSIGSFNKIN